MIDVSGKGKAYNVRHLDKAPNSGKEMDLVAWDWSSYSGGDGSKIDKYTRIQCEAWYKKQAHGVSEGDEVYVKGRLLSKMYEKDGKKHHKFFINVYEVDILKGRVAQAEEQPVEDEAVSFTLQEE